MKISFHGDLMADAAPFGAPNRMGSLPPAAAPWRGSFSSAPNGGAPHSGDALGRASVQAPLKRGLSPPSGGDWGFLASCRGCREGRGKKPSVTASPCHLPFQGRFLRCPRTDGAQRRGCRGIGQTQNFPTRTPSRRSNAESLRPPPHRPAWWQVPRQAHSAGAEAVILSPSQAPVGREGVQGPSSIARRM